MNELEMNLLSLVYTGNGYPICLTPCDAPRNLDQWLDAVEELERRSLVNWGADEWCSSLWVTPSRKIESLNWTLETQRNR